MPLDEFPHKFRKAHLVRGLPEPLQSHVLLNATRMSYEEVRSLVDAWLVNRKAWVEEKAAEVHALEGKGNRRKEDLVVMMKGMG